MNATETFEGKDSFSYWESYGLFAIEEQVWFQKYETNSTHNNIPSFGTIVSISNELKNQLGQDTISNEPLFSILIDNPVYYDTPEIYFIPLERVFRTKQEAISYTFPKGSCAEDVNACEILNEFVNSKKVGTVSKTFVKPLFRIDSEGGQISIVVELKEDIESSKVESIEIECIKFVENLLSRLNWDFK